MLNKTDKTLLQLTAICFAFITIRISYTQSIMFIFLVWNLFLAGIPYLISRLGQKATKLNKTKLIFLTLGWLVIFPNAPYIITDFVHLRMSSPTLFWFDLCLITIFSLTGLAYGMYSLTFIANLITKAFNKKISHAFVITTISLSGFGMYLGRVLRWNSWDIISNPFNLLKDVTNIIIHPIDNKEVFIISLAFSMLILSTYILFKRTISLDKQQISPS